MNEALSERLVEVDGISHRVWSQGSGDPVGFLPGVGGLPRWHAFLDHMASERRVIAPSLPGSPGAAGHDRLDTHLDWLLATRDLLVAAGLEGCDLVAVSVSAPLAADIAALWQGFVKRLVLVAPFGLFDAETPTADIWAQRPGHLNGLLCREAQTYKDFVAPPADADPIEWKVEQMRALEAAARFLFPLGDTGLIHRLHRIDCPTLLVWGLEDRVIPRVYAAEFRDRIAGPTALEEIPESGHLVDLDQPALLAERVLRYFVRSA